jgi:hypothetical protein
MGITLRLLYIGTMSMLLVCCGGADPKVDSRANKLINSVASSSGTTGSAGNSNSANSSNAALSPNPNLTYLNCLNLDPDQVYLLGTFSPATGDYKGLQNLASPRDFCVHFPNKLLEELVVISKSGRLIYKDTDVYLKTTTELKGILINGATSWLYEDSAYKSDELLFNAQEDSVRRNILLTRFNSTTGVDEVYSQADQTIFLHNSSVTPLIDDANGAMLGVMPDGSILIANSSLSIIEPGLATTSLELPVSGTFKFYASKLFINPNTGTQDAWILVADSNNVFHRWHLDLAKKTLADDGKYSAEPNGITPLSSDGNSKIDGAGDLIQIGIDESKEDFRNHLVMKRPLESSGQVASILFNDADYTGDFTWSQSLNPVLHVQRGFLVTGP